MAKNEMTVQKIFCTPEQVCAIFTVIAVFFYVRCVVFNLKTQKLALEKIRTIHFRNMKKFPKQKQDVLEK